ncbi:NodT family efflux transporter outer membrane factor (OMF) lipoprotein [Pedobacter psychrotolerans]|uniref:NodT family efflux transporter outer membrane factor (OMF) lipoprotein n=2 Tax=Pedobacter psychrotolerans TaxID=1843235 RepID=A0A4R2H6D2_9SPHI|nr:TolC family protein [Pedobacter psychrotolerans]TCO21659.1 NodT family efflux transporter outer membrane factor (OMF) lipoprotein [Pedobacter psychrotolerans]
MKRFNIFIILLLAMIWSGCSVSQNLALPESLAPGMFRNSMPKDSSSIGDLPLKSFINDLTVQNLIDTALVRNYDMQIALKNIDAAEVLFKQSKLGYLPELKLQVTGSSSRPSDNSLNGLSLNQFTGTTHIEDYNANLGVFWEADIWGKIRNQKAGALASFLQTGEARKAIQTRLVANVAQGYYNLLMLDAQLDIARKNLMLNDSTLRIINLQFDAGQVTSLAIQQAEAQQLNAAQLIPRLEQNVALQENALSVLIGTLPKSIVRLSRLDQMTIPKDLNAGFPSALLSRRPDIKSAELALNVANARVGVAKASLYPSLVITASGGINSFKASNWFSMPASLFGMVSGGITQPIFQRGQLKSNLELAKIDREKTVIQFRQSVINAVGEVSDELTKFEKLRTQYSIAEKRAQTLQQASRNASLLFKSGMANYLEVITAQGNLLQSELELTTIKTEQLNAVVGLYRSLGGGWN